MLILGIDTGGTYTDGVILDRETRTVLHTAKALTMPENLSAGITACMRALRFSGWEQIGMVGLSTTLVTNAIVEGSGCRAGLRIRAGIGAAQPAERLLLCLYGVLPHGSGAFAGCAGAGPRSSPPYSSGKGGSRRSGSAGGHAAGAADSRRGRGLRGMVRRSGREGLSKCELEGKPAGFHRRVRLSKNYKSQRCD